MLRGSDDVLRACKDAARLKGYGDTSADGLFTLTEVECLGACVNAPILQVDDDYYEDLDYDRTVQLIEALRRGERPPPGSTIGRQTQRAGGRPADAARRAVAQAEVTTMALQDKDRIFTNLYGTQDWGLAGGAQARQLGRHRRRSSPRAATGSSRR